MDKVPSSIDTGMERISLLTIIMFFVVTFVGHLWVLAVVVLLGVEFLKLVQWLLSL